MWIFFKKFAFVFFFFSFSFIREPSPEVLRRWEWRCKNRCPAPGTCFVCVFLSHSRVIKMGKHVCSTGNSIRGLQAPGAYCTLLLSSCFDHEMKKKKRKRKKNLLRIASIIVDLGVAIFCVSPYNDVQQQTLWVTYGPFVFHFIIRRPYSLEYYYLQDDINSERCCRSGATLDQATRIDENRTEPLRGSFRLTPPSDFAPFVLGTMRPDDASSSFVYSNPGNEMI